MKGPPLYFAIGFLHSYLEDVMKPYVKAHMPLSSIESILNHNKLPHFCLIVSCTLRSPALQNWDFRHFGVVPCSTPMFCTIHCGIFAILWQSLRFPTLTTAGRLTILRIWTHRQCEGIYRMASPQVVYVHEGEVEYRLWQEGRKERNAEFATTYFAFWWQKNWNQNFYHYKK